MYYAPVEIIKPCYFSTRTFFLNKKKIIGPVGRVFANDPGDQGSIPGRVIPKTLKMVLDTSLLNTQQYKVRIEGKVEQFRERSSTPLHLGVIEKGPIWLPSTTVANNNNLYVRVILNTRIHMSFLILGD